MSFIERYGLWTGAQEAAARDMVRTIAERGLETVRVAFADQHGLLRGKTMVAADILKTLHAGVRMVGTLLLKDTSNRTAFQVFSPDGGFDLKEFEGAADLVLVPDPATFRVLPWAERSGWVLCEAHFQDGRPVPFDTRRNLRQALRRLAESGFDYVTGLEVELHIFRLLDPRLSESDSRRRSSCSARATSCSVSSATTAWRPFSSFCGAS